jgi:hypothetical protein
MRYELWCTKEGKTYSLFPETNEQAKKLTEEDSVLITVFEANSWEEACQKYNDFLNYGEYKPYH